MQVWQKVCVLTEEVSDEQMFSLNPIYSTKPGISCFPHKAGAMGTREHNLIVVALTIIPGQEDV